MAKPKPEQQPASMPDQAGGTGAGAPDAAPPAMGGRDAMTETAEGAVQAPAGAPADTGAGLGDPAPVTAFPLAQSLPDAWGAVPTAEVEAWLRRLPVNVREPLLACPPLYPAVLPWDLCSRLAVEPEDVFAFNLQRAVVVTRDGQKHRLA